MRTLATIAGVDLAGGDEERVWLTLTGLDFGVEGGLWVFCLRFTVVVTDFGRLRVTPGLGRLVPVVFLLRLVGV